MRLAMPWARINTMEIDLKVGSLLVGFSILQFTFACRRGNAIEGG